MSTAKIPTKAPALNMPVITEQLLKTALRQTVSINSLFSCYFF
jgi:hypothetical protein